MKASTLVRTVAATALLMGLAHGAGAEILAFTGDTTGAPTYTRPEEDPRSWPDGYVYPGAHYLAYDVLVPQAGNPYNFSAVCAFDCSLYIYRGAFDPADPTSNYLAGNGNYMTYFAVAFGGPLDPGHYTLVVTGENATEFGGFSAMVSGPKGFTVTALAPVPEPSAWLMLGTGLAALGAAARRRAARSTVTKGARHAHG